MASEKENLYVILIHSERSWHVKQTAQNKGKTKGSIIASHCSFEAGVAQKQNPKQENHPKKTKGGHIRKRKLAAGNACKWIDGTGKQACQSAVQGWLHVLLAEIVLLFGQRWEHVPEASTQNAHSPGGACQNGGTCPSF